MSLQVLFNVYFLILFSFVGCSHKQIKLIHIKLTDAETHELLSNVQIDKIVTKNLPHGDIKRSVVETHFTDLNGEVKFSYESSHRSHACYPYWTQRLTLSYQEQYRGEY